MLILTCNRQMAPLAARCDSVTTSWISEGLHSLTARSLLTSSSFYRATAKHTHGLAVDICPSVCLSNACIVTKRKHLAKKVQL